ncbi:MAG: RagB/SusD family nutrient uptake outer membrane protein, partial [Proteiniphilum sp.]
MTYIQKYLSRVILLAFVFSSCNLIDIDPISEIPENEMWVESKDARAGVNQIYALFRTAMRKNYYFWGEFRSDNFTPGNTLATDQQDLMYNLLTSSHPSTEWASLYRAINQANLAIKYLPGTDMGSVTEKNDLIAQSHAMRALCYFYAIRVWGDVPLYTEPNELYSEALYKERMDADYILR